VSNENPSKLPAGYALDLVDDPCVIVLRRGGGEVVARFRGRANRRATFRT
jgi:hypothetical protein